MLNTIFAAAMAAALAATPVLADNGKGKKHKTYSNHFSAHVVQVSCPPGLAKKNPPCVPPGLAKKGYVDHDDDHDHDYDHDHDHDYVHDHPDYDDDYRVIRIGDLIDDRFVRIDDPLRYGLNSDYYYYRTLDRVFQVDPETREVLAFIGLVDALLN
jgi:hypothetical protein